MTTDPAALLHSFPEPWPEVFAALGYAKEPHKLPTRRRVELSGRLKGELSARELCARIRTLAPLAHLPRLEELELCRAPVEDLSPLAELDGLKSVVLAQTRIRSLSPLRRKARLRRLSVWCTEVAQLDALATASALEQLSIEYTGVVDLSPLAELRKLTLLDISGTPVRDLTPLKDVPLMELRAYRTHVSADTLGEFSAAHPKCRVLVGFDYPSREARSSQ